MSFSTGSSLPPETTQTSWNGTNTTAKPWDRKDGWTDFEQFCGYSPFFNKSLLLESHYPRFTPCFKEVGFVWIPCLVFLAGVPLYLLYLHKRTPQAPLNPGIVSITKAVLSIALAILSVVKLIVRGTDDDQGSIVDAEYVSEGLKVACFLSSLPLLRLDLAAGVVAPFYLWMFWMSTAVAAIVPVYSNAEEDGAYDDDTFGYIVSIIYVTLTWLQLVANSLVDKRRLEYDQFGNVSENPSPELSASVPSRLLHFWIVGLLWQGYRHHLGDDNTFDPNPEDTSEALTPIFEKKWQEEAERCRVYNSTVYGQSGKVHRTGSSLQIATEKTPLVSGLSPPTHDEDISPLKTPHVARVVFKIYGLYLIAFILLRICGDLLLYASPKTTQSLMEHIQKKHIKDLYPMMFPDEREWKGYVLASSYLVIQSVSSIMVNFSTMGLRRIGIQIRAMLISAVYKKSLTLSTTGLNNGQVVNLMAVDAQRIEDVCQHLGLLFSLPLQLVLAIYMVYDQLEEGVFAGFGVFFLAAPFVAVLMQVLRKYQKTVMAIKDSRIKLISEILNGIKVLKFYAWEKCFEERVQEIRGREAYMGAKVFKIWGILRFVFFSIIPLVKVVAFAVYIEAGDAGYLTPTRAYTAIAVIDVLQTPLMLFPILTPSVAQSIVSLGRVTTFLNLEDIRTDNVTMDPKAKMAVKITDGEFSWDRSKGSTLKKINLSIKPGSLVAVVGNLGSGKSSLLAATLGEMERVQGKVTIKSSVAYLPQEVWTQNTTAKENILFGSPYHEAKYDRIVEACGLKHDFEILTAGDETIIGEKGITMSGGQNQRISLARAVYSERDILLLDDPLGALDSHVAKHVFTRVLSHTGLLKDKTRVVVTHSVNWLPMVDLVVVMDKGRISQMGTYDQLLAQGGKFADFLSDHVQEDEIDFSSDDGNISEGERIKKRAMKRLASITGSEPESEMLPYSSNGVGARPKRGAVRDVSKPRMSEALILAPKLSDQEVAELGRVKWTTFKHYFNEIGLFTFFMGGVMCLAVAGLRSFGGIWTAEWTGDDYLNDPRNVGKSKFDRKTNMYIWSNAAIGVAAGLPVLFYAYLSANKMIKKAAKNIHTDLLANVLRSPLTFFTTKPLGRILNRFSNDMESLDILIPHYIENVILAVANYISCIIITTYNTEELLWALIPITGIYGVLMMLYLPSYRQLRRIDNISRSPIYAHFSETLRGTAIIRAYRAQAQFRKESQKRVNHNLKYYIPYIVVQIWMLTWTGLLGSCVVFSAALVATSSDSIDIEIVGMIVSTASLMTLTMNMAVQYYTQFEIELVAMERIKEYTASPQEAAWYRASPEPQWPDKGEISFQNYHARYRPGLGLVLKDVNCDIQSGERIGIVGRSGAGKSSLTSALFRLIEAAGGRIVIDGLTIADLGLHDLRKKITILPQDPVVFSGTLRHNLDPFEQYSEDQVWAALERAHLKDLVHNLPGGLDFECGNEGSQLSLGQRQLLCLARALLRKTQILVLDEATAAVDHDTDELVQATIRSDFTHCTILTIAHRLSTIMDYDRVMVLDKGVIQEFDTPSRLLSDEHSLFHSIARAAGLKQDQ